MLRLKFKMPLKFRLRKTRNYNVLSRNVLVLSVELIDRTTLECTLSSDSTGLDCLHNVCQRLGLQQPEFFGLRYMSKRPYPKLRWVELERPLKRQLDKYAQSPALNLAVQYYIHDVGLLQDDVTRSHYFLQVKQDVLEGRLRCNYEQAVLLASYSLQAEFGDHQPERHTPEYLKDFRLFPKQAVSESEVGSLLEAVVWQYSSLTGLGQALAETYYILEAQRLVGYGQETFIARDEKGSEVYLGASLLGLVVEPASGAVQTFYKWNDIKNLINHKRNFGIECSRSDDTVQFSFEEPDAAKYVWKMCVKQHTFYKGNEDVLDVVSGGMETRSLAIPDLQSSVMASYKGTHVMNQPTAHELVKNSNMINESFHEELSSRTFASSLPHLDLSFIPKSNDVTTQGSAIDTSTQLASHDSFNIMTQSGLSINATRFSTKQGHPRTRQTPQQYGQTKQDVSNRHYIYSDHNSSIRLSGRRAHLPQYRPAPDYETALMQKYGPGVNSRLQTTMLYSSQPEISTQNNDGITDNDREGGLQPSYSQYNAYTDLTAYSEYTPQHQRLNPMMLTGTLHNTYSTPELAQSSNDTPVIKDPLDYHFIHGYKPPPPYPYSKPSSNSTPDLASACKSEEDCVDSSGGRKRLSLLTASLGCLGSPELSRTYENLSDLTEAVESLRQELTKGESSFLHSFAPNYSTDNLDAIYQLSNGRVAAIEQNYNLKNSQNTSFNGFGPAGSTPEEPIYQNVGAILSDVNAERRGRAKSAPELDAEEGIRLTTGEESRLGGSSHPQRGIEHNPYETTSQGGVQFVTLYDNSQQQHAFALQQIHGAQSQQQQIQSQQQLQQRTVQTQQQKQTQLQQQQQQQQTQLQQQQLKQAQSQQQQLKQNQLHQQQIKQSQSQQLMQTQSQQPQPQQHLKQLQQPQQQSQQQLTHSQLQSGQQGSHPQSQIQKVQTQLLTQSNTMPQQSHLVQQQQVSHSTFNAQQGTVGTPVSQLKEPHSPARQGQRTIEEGKKTPTSNSSSKTVQSVSSQKEVKKPDLLLESSSFISKDPKTLELQQKIASMDIVREYEAIPRIKKNPDFTSSVRSENISRNRYKDIVPYEENRVKITPSKDNKAGYINASHITASVGNTQRFYICAQGPLPTTVGHFWQCVWEADVRLIVMLAAVEGDTNTSKSFPYWPQMDNTSVECDKFRIYRKQSTTSGFHVTSRLQLVQMAERKSRSVWHLQFTDWADHGCPEDTHSFLNFLEELSSLRRVTFDEVQGVGKNRNTPVLVHCSAGVGRSGVTILCDLLMEASRHNLPLDPPKLLSQLRQQRMALVQSFNQYKFVYRVLLASLQSARLI